MQKVYDSLISVIDEKRIMMNEPMSKHTTFKIGGPADIFVKIKSIDELKFVNKVAKESNIALKIVGNCSNILVGDKGFRGIIAKIDFDDISIENNIMYVEAGALISKVSKYAYDNSLSGLEEISGVPGTIGGAIKMNAGAYEKEIGQIVLETSYLDEKMNIITINNSQHEFEYRKSIFTNKNYIILSTKLKLEKKDELEIKNRMHEISENRKSKQPLNFPSAGSIFKRGEDFIPAELIDKAGLKGYNIGDAFISEKHAGFIVNKGNATAEDVKQLVKYIQEKIYEKYSKNLELEIEFIGE